MDKERGLFLFNAFFIYQSCYFLSYSTNGILLLYFSRETVQLGTNFKTLQISYSCQ